jgi:hypothetical protein
MNVSLTADESQVIRKALHSYLKELRGEIADTDNPQYKRELREERAQLESAVAKLDSVAVSAEGDAGATCVVEMWWVSSEL